MAILVICSNSECGELIDVPDQAAGTQMACPSCGTMLTVPGVAAGPGPGLSEPEQPAVLDAGPPVDQSPTAEKKTSQDKAPAPEGGEPIDLAAMETPPQSVSAEMAALLRETSKPAPSEPIDLSVDASVPASPSIERSGHDVPPEPEPAEHAEIDLGELMDDTLAILPPEQIAADIASRSVDEGALENESVSIVPFVLGMVAMACGLAVGVFAFQGNRLLGAYVGAGLGWVSGFIFGFMVVFAIDRGGIRMVRCSVCDNLFPLGTRTCKLCGSVLSAKLVNPLAAECIQAGSYAVGNLAAVYLVSMAMALGNCLVAGVSLAKGELPPAAWYSLVGLCAVYWLLAMIYWAALLCGGIRGTLVNPRKKFTAPDFWSAATFEMGLKGICVLVGYTLPVITIPLIPFALLSIGLPGGNTSLRPDRVLAKISGSARDAAVLWLFVLVWLAGLALSVSVGQVLLSWLEGVMPEMEGSSQLAMSMVHTAIWAGAMTAIITIFSLAVARCAGMFGLINRKSLVGAGYGPVSNPITGRQN